MREEEAAALAAFLQPLLRALEMLMFIQRHLHPPDFGELMASIGEPDATLQAAQARLPAWPPALTSLAGPLQAASEAALQAFAGLRNVLMTTADVRAAYR